MLWKQTCEMVEREVAQIIGRQRHRRVHRVHPNSSRRCAKARRPRRPTDIVRQPVALAPTERRPVTLPLAISEGLAADLARARRRL